MAVTGLASGRHNRITQFMPASRVMELYREGKLHSGPTGTIVTKKAQAKAIMLSYLRKEGKSIPEATK